MSRWRNHGTTSNITLTILHYFTNCFQFIGSLVYPVSALIEVLEFRVWLNKRFGIVTHFKNKQKLLGSLIKRSNLESSRSEAGVF